MFPRPGSPGDRASDDRLLLRKGPVHPQEETSGRQHNRDPGPGPASGLRLSNAWTSSSVSGCSGGPRPLPALCLLPPRPMKTGSLTPRPDPPSSRAPGGSGQRAKAPLPICALGPVAAATPGSQPWSPPPPSSSRLRGNKERRRRSRSTGADDPPRPRQRGRLAITPRRPPRPPPPPPASPQGLHRPPPRFEP
jgi:hypothetical protein